jgi:hypothetical protein
MRTKNRLRYRLRWQFWDCKGNGKPIIKKSDTLKDTIPSCVSVNKRKKNILQGMLLLMLKIDKYERLK